MDLDALNAHLRPWKLNFVCVKCSAAPRDLLSPSAAGPPLQQKENFRSRRIKKHNSGSKRSSANRQLGGNTSPVRIHRNSAKRQTQDKFKTQKKPSNPRARYDLDLSPVKPRCPPNHSLNSNTHQQKSPVMMNEFFEDSINTPIKKAKVNFPSAFKNLNVIDFDYKPRLFSTGEAKERAADVGSLKDFSFVSDEEPNFANFVAFPRAPSCFESPFPSAQPRLETPTPPKSLCYNRISRQLDFLNNPNMDDFE